MQPEPEKVLSVEETTRIYLENMYKKGLLNMITQCQLDKVFQNITDIDFLEDEIKELMNEPDTDYIASKISLKPPKNLPRKDIDPKEIVIGAIIGDVVGSRYEFTAHNYIKAQYEDLPPKKSFFTDDTVLSIATMNAVLEKSNNPNFRQHYIDAYEEYPRAGYGATFVDWALNEIDNTKGYNSIANGCAMRLSFIPAYYDDYEIMLKQIAASVLITHNHIESVKHSMILATTIWMALHNYDKEDIKLYCDSQYSYTQNEKEQLFYGHTMDDWSKPLSDYSNDMNRQTIYVNNAVPFAIKCFLETEDYESCMREILSHFGDTDTICAIAGGLCVAYYGTTGMDNEKILRNAQVPEI